MSIATMILGESGTGKSSSLRGLNPDDALLIQVIKKPLPFRAVGWSYRDKDKSPAGNIFVTDNYDAIKKLIDGTKKKIIIIDDWQYMLANEFMRRSAEKGFEKFTQIGFNAWDLAKAAGSADDGKRIYLLSHTHTTDDGVVKAKTIGKLLDDKITLEGMFTIVLRTSVIDGQYSFATQNNGNDTVKSPIGLFESSLIDNDLSAVDKAICEYYSIN